MPDMDGYEAGGRIENEQKDPRYSSDLPDQADRHR
jgi:hypothetical protein